jgi:hypothetical protein
MRSDLPLDIVHQAIQAAFGWWDYHPVPVRARRSRIRATSQGFLCPHDKANPEFDDDDDGLSVAEVRLDETLSKPGDRLLYVYDYGDNWQLTLELEDVLDAGAEVAAATLVDGKRAAPPEDCGHLTTEAELAEVLDDPARFPAEEIAAALRGPHFVAHQSGLIRGWSDCSRGWSPDRPGWLG